MRRWRLILGSESQERFGQMGGKALDGEDALMDQALAAIYSRSEEGGFGSGTGSGGAGRGPSTPRISRWLGDVRTLFSQDLVKVIQGDAITRCGLKQMLLEPELLDSLEPDRNLAATILLLKEQVPQRSRESVRRFIRRIVEDINRMLEQDVRRAVTAAINRRAHSPIPSATALDYRRTIRSNLKHYDPERKTILPEHFWFFERSSQTGASRWTVILDVDQSGSMGESVLYSGVLASILASMASLKTRVVAFDTNVVDLTDRCADPVDLIFGFQLGGGTDINRSVAYCQQFVENPRKTLLFLITDLEEGGNRAALLRRLEEMKQSGVTVACLLAISDAGRPYYDAEMARKVAGLGIPCFACSPEMLPRLLELALRHQDLSAFQKEFEKRRKA